MSVPHESLPAALPDREWPEQGAWTYADYCRLPDDGWRYEVIKGVLHVAPAPRPKHQIAVGNLHYLLRRFLDHSPLGKVFLAPIDLILPGGIATPVQPDLLFLFQEDLAMVKEGQIEGVPALVVKVLSPSNWLDDRRDKFIAYAEAGVAEYWILDPEVETVELFVLREGGYELLGKYGAGEQARSQVLAGFQVAVGDLFAL